MLVYSHFSGVPLWNILIDNTNIKERITKRTSVQNRSDFALSCGYRTDLLNHETPLCLVCRHSLYGRLQRENGVRGRALATPNWHYRLQSVYFLRWKERWERWLHRLDKDTIYCLMGTTLRSEKNLNSRPIDLFFAVGQD